MNVYRFLQDTPTFRNAVLTIGTFDGVHLGHQRIIQRIRSLAKEAGGESVLLTFHPHPRQVLHPEDDSLKLIQTLDERIASLDHYGIDNLLIATFSNAFSHTEPQAYVREFLVKKINPRAIVIGYNHRFGHDRKGDVNLLQSMSREFKFTVHLISKEEVDHISVSSTNIRTALMDGDIDLANKLLGHPFELNGIVIRGNGMGAQLGYPTANIFIEEESKIIPGAGIFAVRVHHAGASFKGMLYIGYRPTFSGTEKSIEVNIFDFDQSIYGDKLRLELVATLRGDQRFDSTDELKEQLGRDKVMAAQFLSQRAD
jgi:riboflavin kinase/FMN adenylyltransferase